jgi:hypothetical protein
MVFYLHKYTYRYIIKKLSNSISTLHYWIMSRLWSGSQGSLLNPSPIRTLLVSFPTHGSSLSKAAFQQPGFTASNVWQLRRLYNTHLQPSCVNRRRMHMQ